MTKYSTWSHYFRYNTWLPAAICPPQAQSLSFEERDCITPSIQHFQLGESSDGNGLLLRARKFGEAHGQDGLPEAMESFIREEQRHAAVLGLFLDREGIPRIGHHWSDHLFRKIRNLAGFELMITILTSAELIAFPYYTALHDATNSVTLKRICKRILLDEAQHLEFQADNFQCCTSSRSELAKWLTLLVHWAALTAAAALVYLLHAKLFRRAKMSPLRMWAMAFKAHDPVFSRLTQPQRPISREATAYLP
jgi:hypothetical protein